MGISESKFNKPFEQSEQERYLEKVKARVEKSIYQIILKDREMAKARAKEVDGSLHLDQSKDLMVSPESVDRLETSLGEPAFSESGLSLSLERKTTKDFVSDLFEDLHLRGLTKAREKKRLDPDMQKVLIEDLSTIKISGKFIENVQEYIKKFSKKINHDPQKLTEEQREIIAFFLKFEYLHRKAQSYMPFMDLKLHNSYHIKALVLELKDVYQELTKIPEIQQLLPGKELFHDKEKVEENFVAKERKYVIDDISRILKQKKYHRVDRNLTFGQTALAEQRKKFCEKERMEPERSRA